MNPEILYARVGHERFTQRHHAFVYRVFYIVTPVRDEMVPTPRLFSFDRFNVFSLHRKDHGARDNSSWRAWIQEQCRAQGMTLQPEDRVLLIAHPRLFGYAFNPITFWLVFEKETYLKAVVCEVHNTFGSTHNYFLAHKDFRAIMPEDVLSAKKNLYVSPFNDVPPGSYTFSFTLTPEMFSSDINYYEDGVHVLRASMRGTRAPLTAGRIATAVLSYPFMTLLVIFRIHYQALRLYLKGVKHTLDRKPPHTEGGTTRGSDINR